MTAGELRRRGELELRDASTGDLERLIEIEDSCFDPPWSRAALAQEIGRADSVVRVAALSGTVVGYAALRLAPGEAELLRLAVLPAARRRGTGRRLVDSVTARLDRYGVEHCFLEVREDNEGAMRFYERVGWRRAGRREAYYPDGRAALLYTLEVERPGAAR